MKFEELQDELSRRRKEFRIKYQLAQTRLDNQIQHQILQELNKALGHMYATNSTINNMFRLLPSTGNIHNLNISKRLEKLKTTDFLTQRVVGRMSEAMHYEIFKYLGPRDLMDVRGTKLGGYELVSNKHLRSNIKNYFPFLYIRIYKEIELDEADRKIKLIIEQTEKEVLNFEGKELKLNIYPFLRVLKYNPHIREFNLSK